MSVAAVTDQPGEDDRNGSPDEDFSQAWTFRTLQHIESSNSRVSNSGLSEDQDGAVRVRRPLNVTEQGLYGMVLSDD